MLGYVRNVVLKLFLFKHGVSSRDTGQSSVLRTVLVKSTRTYVKDRERLEEERQWHEFVGCLTVHLPHEII